MNSKPRSSTSRITCTVHTRQNQSPVALGFAHVLSSPSSDDFSSFLFFVFLSLLSAMLVYPRSQALSPSLNRWPVCGGWEGKGEKREMGGLVKRRGGEGGWGWREKERDSFTVVKCKKKKKKVYRKKKIAFRSARVFFPGAENASRRFPSSEQVS